MNVFNKDLIDELEAELLNHYLMIIWFEDYLNNGLTKLEIKFGGVLEEKSNPKKFKDLLNLATDAEVKVTGKKNLGSQKFQEKLRFTEEEYKGIYEEMGQSSKNPRYYFIKEYGYSINDLIIILDQLATLKNKLEGLNDSEKNKLYKDILHQYSGLDLLGHGFKNPSLKQRIIKGRSFKGGYQKIVKDKKQIFFDLLVEQTKNGRKYKNISQAVKNNIDEVMHRFQEFDERWINSKLEINRGKILELQQENAYASLTASKKEMIKMEITKLSTFVQLLEDSLNSGYPFEKLNNILPYNTVSLEEVLMKVLRVEKSIKEQCVEQ